MDASFNPGSAASDAITSISVQSDGKILAAGNFNTFNGGNHGKIVRLLPNGMVDPSFQCFPGPNDMVLATALQSDGKILIGGIFTSVNGQMCNRIARLNADGTLDNTFIPNASNNASSGANQAVRALAVQSDGKIIIAGSFTAYQGVTRQKITRLHADGSIDYSFDPGSGVEYQINALSLLPNGQMLIGGWWYSINGNSDLKYWNMARLNSDGSHDTSFGANLNIISTTGQVFAIAQAANHAFFVGGNFDMYDFVTVNNLVKLNHDGTMDPTFNASTGTNGFIWALAVQPDGKVLIGGDFTQANGQSCSRLARLKANGSLDSSFSTTTGANDGVRALTTLNNGKILMGGLFTDYKGQSANRIARLNGNQILIPPTTTLDSVSNVHLNSCSVYARVTDDGGSSVSARGFCYNTTGNPSLVDNFTQNGTDTGSFSATLIGLSASTVYHVRAYATNSIGTAYSAAVQFTTLTPINPSASTDSIGRIQQLSAVAYGRVLSLGALPLSARGFCFNTIGNPDLSSSFTSQNISAVGNYLDTLQGLLPNTTYYYRAYATNAAGTGYGHELQFNTLPISLPTTSTDSVNSISPNSANVFASIQHNGGDSIVSKGFCYSLNGNPDFNDFFTQDGSGNSPFNTTMVGLQHNTVYYVRAYATNSVGTAYGNELNFTTTSFQCSSHQFQASASGLGFNEQILNWNSIPGSMLYVVQYRLQGAASWLTQTTTQNHIQLNHLQPGTYEARFYILGTGDTACTINFDILNRSGLVDNTFLQQFAINGGIKTIYRQSDGKWLVGGHFSFLQNTHSPRLARLLSDGYRDPSLLGLGASGSILSTAVQSDGKIWIGGTFTTYAGFFPPSGLALIKPDGTTHQPFVASLPHVRKIAIQPDGKILIAGDFVSLNFSQHVRLARINPSGGFDASFNIGSGFNGPVYCLAIQSDGKILVGGNFSAFNGIAQNNLARLNADGSLDLGFQTGQAANAPVKALGIQFDGKILVGGEFTVFNQNQANRLLRLHPNGTFDSSFYMGSGANGAIHALAVQPNGKILIGGSFTAYNGTALNRLTRLLINGNPDTVFNQQIGSAANDTVQVIDLEPNGKIMVAGDFSTFNNMAYPNILRIHGDYFSLPLVQTENVTSVGITQVQVEGSVSYNGEAFITARGFCYNTNGNPNLSDNTLQVGSGSGNFGASISHLIPNTTYYIRAYATNSAGTAYGQILNFTTLPIVLPSLTTDSLREISAQSVEVFAEISSDGGAVVTARGFCYNTNGNPDLSDNTLQVGSGSGNFNASISNLLPNTTYYIRAYATNSVGTAYGQALNFTTLPIVLPSVTTDSVKVINTQLAVAYAKVLNDGNSTVTDRGFSYNTSGNPDLSNNTVQSGSGVGSFSANLLGLQGSTKYYLNAFATNSLGTAFGDQQVFTTPCNTHNLSSVAGASGHYNQRFNWTAIAGAGEHRLQYRMAGNISWSGVNEPGTQRLIQNLPPGNYEARIYAVGLGDTSCIIMFSIACATDISYSTNLFQAAYLNALPASSARIKVFNLSGGKSLYNFELENQFNGSSLRVEGRRNYTFNQLEGGSYALRVYDAYNCQSSNVFNFSIYPLDTAYIPNLISVVNSSPNGFRPIWNRPRSNGQITPGILSYQLRVRNETDNQLVNLYTGITDTFFHVNNLIPGKLYRFNVRSRYQYSSGGSFFHSAFSIRRDRSLGAGGNKEEGGAESAELIRIYPNPTADVVYVESPLGSKLELFDLQGRLLQTHTAQGPVSSIDLSAYAKGSYILEIEHLGQISRQKVVRQ